MAIFSGSRIISSIALFHITVGFFLLTNPSMVTDQTMVFIVGEAMGMPHVRAFDQKSAPLSFLAVLFIFLGVIDLTTTNLPDEVQRYYWGSQAPIRLFALFVLTFYSFAFSPASPLMAGKPYETSAWGEGLKNRVVFSWAFLEMVTWFWAFVTLREERKEAVARLQEKMQAEEKMM